MRTIKAVRAWGVWLATMGMLLGGGVSAQEQDEDQNEEDERLEEIVVTGTQIRGTDITGLMPVTVFGRDEIDGIEATTAGQIFDEIPQAIAEIELGDLANVFSGFLNAARGDVTGLNLRNLGLDNTLQMINGRRLVRHPGSQFYGLVPISPVNTSAIPVRGIRRVEILRDGASAIYGADAVAGVANTILRDNYEGLTIDLNYGFSDPTSKELTTINLLGGRNFNEGRTNVSMTLHYTDRDGYMATDRERSSTSDLRPFYVGTPFEGDTQLDNRGTYGPWGQFQVQDQNNGFQPIRIREIDGTTITDGSGRFHVQPIEYQGIGACRGDSELDPNPGVCFDDGARHRDHYYDRNPERTVQNDVERLNSYVFINHQFQNDLEGFVELGYYHADSSRQSEQPFFVASGPLTVSPQSYWNPFGERLSGNPNRLPNANIPDEGYAVNFQAYRQTDVGPATADIENDSYRAVAGLRGTLSDWFWETALVYSEASTFDMAHNWQSSTLFMDALNRTDETAYNPFNGGCIDAPTLADTCTPGTNSQEVIDSFTIDVTRYNETTLASADLKLSNPALFDGWAGPIGIAAGIEVRREGFKEDRDDRLDGTITYTNPINPILAGDTDVLGLSSTPDADGHVNVLSAFVEAHIPLTDSLEMQLATRFEDYSVVGDILRNKIAIGWHPVDSISLRASFSQGFKVPSLATLKTPAVTRNSSGTDNYRCYAYGLLGTDAEVNALYDSGALTSEVTRDEALAQNDVTCNDGQGDFFVQYLGGPDLRPEESDQYSVGLVFTPSFVDGLTLTADYWRIEQTDLASRLTSNNALALDFAERLNSSFSDTNPAVVRFAPTDDDIELYNLAGLPVAGRVQSISLYYMNLDRRQTHGLDLNLRYRLDTRFGNWSFRLNGTELRKRFTEEIQILSTIDQLGFPDLFTPEGSDNVAIDGRPEWRATGNITWRYKGWQVGLAAKHVTGYTDTSVSNNNQFLEVEGGTVFHSYIQKRFEEGFLDGFRIKLGARNMFNKFPALNDSVYGISNLYTTLEGRYWYTTIAKSFN